MELALLLFTGFAGISCGVAVFCALRTMKAEDRAQRAADRLTKSMGAIHAHTLSLEALDERLRKLNGRVNAALHRRSREPEPEDDDEPSAHAVARANGQTELELDPDLAATLALQRAHTPTPP